MGAYPVPKKVAPVHASLGELEVTAGLAVAEVVWERLVLLRELLCMEQQPKRLGWGHKKMGVE